jgi:hypothetical protein
VLSLLAAWGISVLVLAFLAKLTTDAEAPVARGDPT